MRPNQLKKNGHCAQCSAAPGLHHKMSCSYGGREGKKVPMSDDGKALAWFYGMLGSIGMTQAEWMEISQMSDTDAFAQAFVRRIKWHPTEQEARRVLVTTLIAALKDRARLKKEMARLAEHSSSTIVGDLTEATR